ncbi:MAG: hypothetical protein Q9169_007680 [Polycauliona sp. 2 TL-2023]
MSKIQVLSKLHLSMELDILLFLSDPLPRPALGKTLFSALSLTRTHIQKQGGGWLSASDDPFFSSSAEATCFLRIDSAKTAATGRRMMTYSSLLAVLEALWQLLYMEREEWSVSFRMRVVGVTAGHGAVATHEMRRPGELSEDGRLFEDGLDGDV